MVTDQKVRRARMESAKVVKMVMRVRAVRRRSWGSVWGLEYCGVLVAPRAEGEWGRGETYGGSVPRLPDD